MSSPVPNEMVCQQCSTPGTGRFCSECGAPLNDARCSSCGEPLTPGSKFCHHCGATAGAAANSGAAAQSPAPRNSLASTLPWAVASIAFLALFAMLAAKGLNSRRGSTLDAPSNALANPALDGPAMGSQGAGPFAGGGMAGGEGIRAPDISKMDPQEIADRLFNRIMTLNTEGKTDSVQFFAPMAIQAYQMLGDRQGHPFDADQRYDLGRIAAVAGAIPLARAQADTILQQQPDHLLGLLLAAQTAKLAGNTPAQQKYKSHFDRVKTAQLAKNLPEYQRHRSDIDGGI